MIIDTIISESDLSDFYHSTRIDILNITHQTEMIILQNSYLNEADGDNKIIDAFVKFIETIRRKVIELFSKTVQFIQSIIAKYNINKFVKVRSKNKDFLSQIPKASICKYFTNVEYYKLPDSDSLDKLLRDIKTPDEWMKSFKYDTKNCDDIYDKIVNISYSDYIDSAKNWRDKVIKLLDKNKSKSIDDLKNETKKLKNAIDIYSAILKCVANNAKVNITIIISIAKDINSLRITKNDREFLEVVFLLADMYRKLVEIDKGGAE